MDRRNDIETKLKKSPEEKCNNDLSIVPIGTNGSEDPQPNAGTFTHEEKHKASHRQNTQGTK